MQDRQEALIRESIREILRTSNISSSPVLRRTMLGETPMSDWDLARTYAHGGRALLTESQRGRGRLLMEGLLQGLADAAGWIGVKVGSAAAKLKQMGKDALDSAGKALTALLEKIPGGEAAFEMLKDFSSDTAEKIGDYIKDALVEFADFLVEKKDAILAAVFKGAADPGIASKIKELAEKAAEDAKEKADEIRGFVESIISNPVAAVKALLGSRETLGDIAKKIVEVILSSSEKVKSSITGAIMKVEFFSTKPGKLVMRLMTLMSADMGGEQVITAAARVWKSIKGIGKTGVSLDHVGREFRDALPDVVKGLVGGESAVEQIIRSAVGDPSAAAKLMKNSIKMCFNALKKLVDSNMEDALKKIGLDPEGKVGKAVAAGVGALVGAAGGAAGIEEARRLTEMPTRRSTTGRIMTDEYGDQYYNLEPKDVFFGKAQTALDALVAELTSIDRDMVRGLDAMDIHAALDDSGPYMGHGTTPLHQAVHWLRRDDSPDGLANFFYEGLYRSRPAPRRLADQLMSHFAGERNQTKLEQGETAPSARALKFNSNLVAQRVGEALKVVKAVKKAALKASTMGAAAKGLLAEPAREEDTTTVSYSGPDIEIRSGRGSTEAGFGDGDVEGWAKELERLAKWCSTKTTVEFQAANDLSATAYDSEGNDVDAETIVWMADGRDMAREFSKMAKFFRRNVSNTIEVFSD